MRYASQERKAADILFIVVDVVAFIIKIYCYLAITVYVSHHIHIYDVAMEEETTGCWW